MDLHPEAMLVYMWILGQMDSLKISILFMMTNKRDYKEAHTGVMAASAAMDDIEYVDLFR